MICKRLTTIIFFGILVLPGQTALAQELSLKTREWLTEAGIRVSKPARAFKSAAAGSRFLETRIRLSEQRENRLLAPGVKFRDLAARRPSRNKHFFFRDDFERAFPVHFWQLLPGLRGTTWEKTSANALSGSYCLKSGEVAAGGKTVSDHSSPTVSWLVAGPFDSRDLDETTLQFYFSLHAGPDEGVLFWGISVDGEQFHGVSAIGGSNGWQFINYDLGDVAGVKSAGAAQIWIAFLHANRFGGQATAFLDRITFLFGTAWLQEHVATIDGKPNPNAYIGGIGLARPAFVDIDQDGDQDLFVGEYDGNLNFYRNEGTPSRPKYRLLDGNYANIDVGENSSPAFTDYDGDGDADMIVGDFNGHLHLYRNDGTGWRTVWSYLGPLKTANNRNIKVQSTATPTFADVDGDGDDDLTVGDIEGKLAVYRNVGDAGTPVWKVVSRNYFGIDVGSIGFPAWVDIDRDNDLDLFVGNHENSIFFYQNDGSASKAKFSLASKNFDDVGVKAVTSPAFLDSDADGDLDLFLGQAEGEVAFLENNGTPSERSFNSAPQAIFGQTVDVGFQSAPALVDIDADQDLDLVLGAHDGRFHFYRNDGGALHPNWHLVSGYFDSVTVKNWSIPAFADLDGDEDLDLLSGSKLGRMSFFRNTGSKYHPAFELVSDFYDSLFCGSHSFPAFADMDADGDADLFVGTDVNGVAYYQNTGSRQQPAWKKGSDNVLGTSRVYRTAPAFADIDHDGDLDLFVGLNDGTVSVYENTGSRRAPQWRLQKVKFLAIDVRSFSVPTLADIDRDGDSDLFVGNNSGGLFFWRNLSREASFVESNVDLVQRITAWQAMSLQIATPFSSGATVRYRLFQHAPVSVRIYERDGTLVRTLVDELQPAGEYRIAWDGKDTRGREMKGGLYLVRLQAATHSDVRKLVLSR
ncbi:MAG: FG-GAP-like repeat-containing protein [bacterium]